MNTTTYTYHKMNNELVKELQHIGSFQYGSFTLKSGVASSFYCDMRRIISYPVVFSVVIQAMQELVDHYEFNHICAVPYGAVPLATALAYDAKKSLLFLRKEIKDHGTSRLLEGVYKKGDRVLVIEDVMTSGTSIMQAVQQLQNEGLIVHDVIVFLDREQEGKERLAEKGVAVHSVFTLTDIDAMRMQESCVAKKISYADRAKLCTNQTAQKLFMIMEEKKTNVAVAADVATTKAALLQLADQVGPHICMLKTHIDTIVDFDEDLIMQLQRLAEKHRFIIFEDRKFADIGATVEKQYMGGMYRIAEWADIVNAHSIPGAGIIKALQKGGQEKGRGLVLIAHMSSAGALADENYIRYNVQLAQQYADFVIGFITQKKLTDDQRYLHMTPGVHLAAKQDALGQQYITPEQAIEQGADIIIVGRGIAQSSDPAVAAREYRELAWQAYEKQLKKYE